MSDGPWRLEANKLYLHHGEDPPPVSRPLCQGDVFEGTPLPGVDKETPDTAGELALAPQRVMLLPHPCQNYRGDVLRDFLVVAPVREVPRGMGFRSTGSHWDRFPLMGLVGGTNMYCDLARACSVPSKWLRPERRSACLSLDGVTLLSRRLIVCFTRWRKPLHENVRTPLPP